MSTMPSIDDLRLVRTIVDTGSVGAAARSLGVAQPSASARLAAMERRCGTRLFLRDTTGSRPTPAGAELARQAEHVLDHLGRIYATAMAVSDVEPLRIGTFAALSAGVVTALEEHLDHAFTTVIDHGPQLIDLVAESSLDAAVVGVASQVMVPRGLTITDLGRDDLVILRSARANPLRPGGTRLKDRRIIFSTYDARGPHLRERLVAHGARAEPGPTLAATLAMARTHGTLAVLPRSVLAHDLREGEEALPLPFATEITISLVTRRSAQPHLESLAPELGRWLHLRR